MLNIQLSTVTGSPYIHTYIHTYIHMWYMRTLYSPQIQNLAKVKIGCERKKHKKFTVHRNTATQKYKKHFRYDIEMLH